LSGAGKSVAIKSVEDFGGYCVDNMPAALITKFIKLIRGSDYSKSRIALGIDVRSREFMDNIFEELAAIEKLGYSYKIIFLEASNNAVLRRYSESRHRHPMGDKNESLKRTVEKERKKLAPLREKANIIIDTTDMTPHQLKQRLKDILMEKGEKSININIIAFGFKYGVPEDIDLLIDTRFLPNPYYVRELSDKSGKNSKVVEFIMNNKSTERFLKKYKDLLDFLIPNYVKEGKSYLNIGIGCTGGRHRSIVIGDIICRHLKEKNYNVFTTYRDVDK
ncbi:MAG: RNase adapter RapZ, partial [Elusimicrobiota bacterium]